MQASRSKSECFSLALVTLLAFWLPAAARAYTVRVPADYPTIQEGIDAASNGDEVVVAEGTYSGPLNRGLDTRGKQITVRSETRPEGTTIDCQGRDRGFYIHQGESQTTVIRGFTIRRGGTRKGLGIYCEGTSPTITECIMIGGSGENQSPHPEYRGGGIACENGSPVITDCQFISNATTYGGAIYVYAAPSLRIERCSFQGNCAEYFGGGIAMSLADGGVATIEDCLFIGNLTFSNGGAVAESDSKGSSTVVLRSCRFYGNSANSGGCVTAFTSVLEVDGCEFTENVTERNGGLVCNRDAQISNSYFTNNFAGDHGGAMTVWGGLTISHCSFIRCAAGEAGGALRCYGSLVAVDCSFSECAATGQEGYGGGIVLAHPGSRSRIQNCLFTRNTATSGGAALHIGPGNPVLSFDIVSSTFSDNLSQAGDGGALFLEAGATVNCVDSIFYFNSPGTVALGETAGFWPAHCAIEDGWWGPGVIAANPCFAPGPGGEYYLSQTGAGQPLDSPCLDAGNIDASELCFEIPAAAPICLDQRTTRTDGLPDAGIVDIGYHYAALEPSATPVVSATPTVTATATPSPGSGLRTATPTVTPSPAPDVPTATPTPTPTPAIATRTPTPTGELTATPVCGRLSVQVELASHYVHPGDEFWCRAWICSPYNALRGVRFVALLDPGVGAYWFYPDWICYPPDWNWITVDVAPDWRELVEVVPPFIWPDTGAARASRIVIYAALLAPDDAELLGELGWASFGYGPE